MVESPYFVGVANNLIWSEKILVWDADEPLNQEFIQPDPIQKSNWATQNLKKKMFGITHHSSHMHTQHTTHHSSHKHTIISSHHIYTTRLSPHTHTQPVSSHHSAAHTAPPSDMNQTGRPGHWHDPHEHTEPVTVSRMQALLQHQPRLSWCADMICCSLLHWTQSKIFYPIRSEYNSDLITSSDFSQPD